MTILESEREEFFCQNPGSISRDHWQTNTCTTLVLRDLQTHVWSTLVRKPPIIISKRPGFPAP